MYTTNGKKAADTTKVPHPSEKRAIVQAVVNALGNSASICTLHYRCLNPKLNPKLNY